MKSFGNPLKLLLAFVTAVLVLGTAPATGATDEEAPVPDVDHGDDHGDAGGGGEHNSPTRLSCDAIDPGWTELALTGHPVSGRYVVEDENRSVQIFVHDAAAGGKVVNWHADAPIDAVILRSGQDAATYEYEPPSLGATGLLPPLADRDGRNLAAVLVCYAPAEPASGVELFLSDSGEPVAVGNPVDYLMRATATSAVNDPEIVLTLPPEVRAVDAPGCEITDSIVRCVPTLDGEPAWEGIITTTAISPGDAVARAELTGRVLGVDVTATAVEVTRIIAEGQGHEGEDGDHGGPDFTSACATLAPGSEVIILPGPFASRRYLVTSGDDIEIWVTVEESDGAQRARWSSNVPIDGALTRTGRDIVSYPYMPPAFSGTGLVGPASGSGLRPIADIAFCITPQTPVDVRVSIATAPVVGVGEPTEVRVTVTNTGYEAAEKVELQLEAPKITMSAFRDCDLIPTDESGCAIGRLEAGEVTEIAFEARVLEVGIAEVTARVSAVNESPEFLLNNVDTATISAQAAAPAVLVASAQPTALAVTGPNDLLVLWSLAAGMILVGSAALVARRTLTQPDS